MTDLLIEGPANNLRDRLKSHSGGKYDESVACYEIEGNCPTTFIIP